MRRFAQMLMLKALRSRAVLSLWFGQLTSHIGDEIYKVAFIWLAIDVAGSNTGFFASLQIASILLFGILGGKVSDRWNPYSTMIVTDLLRAILTLTPVFFYFLKLPIFGALLISSVMIAGLGAFFEPALQTSLPLICKDRNLLKGANGLLSTTVRLARVLGPALIGLLANLVLTIHYFTLNAVSFIVSALSIRSVQKHFPKITLPFDSALKDSDSESKSFWKHFTESWSLLKGNTELFWVIMMKTIIGGTWGLTYGLGLALLMREFSGNDVKPFGLVMGAYGLGNVLAAIVVGNLERKKPAFLVYLGLLWLGIGFIGIGFSKSLEWILFFSAFCAIGGPLNDLPCTDMIQALYPTQNLPRIFRLKMTLDNVAALALLLISPLLFHFFSTREVIIGCGILTVLSGVIGFRINQSLHLKNA